MNKLLLLAFLVTLLALAAAGSQEEEEEEGALTRLAREADPRRKKKRCGRKCKDRKKEKRKNRKMNNLNEKKKKSKNNKNGNKDRRRPKTSSRRRMGSRKPGMKGCAGGAGRAVSSSSTCLINAMTYLNLTRLQIANYLKQNSRMVKANKTGGSKSGKKGIFAKTAQRMIKAGGGNKSAMACNGNTNTSGAAQMTNVTNILTGCEAKIKAACDTSSFPLPNMTVVAGCVSAMKTFVGMVTYCMGGRNETAACSCWDNTNFTLLANTTIRNCSISSENKLVTAQLKYCKGNFSACKQMEDEGMKAMSSCSQSTASLLADAAALTANSAGLAAAQNTTSSLTGNSTSNSTGRHTRAVVTTCAAVISTIAKILIIVDQSTTSTQISTLAATVTGVTGVTCTTTEIASLNTQSTSLTAAKTSVDGNLATVQADLLTATGSTASSASISAATSATAAASARRNIVARHLLNRLNLN